MTTGNGSNGVAVATPVVDAINLQALWDEVVDTVKVVEHLVVTTATTAWVGKQLEALNAKIDGVAQTQVEMAPALAAAEDSLNAITVGLDQASATLATFTERLAAVQNPLTGLAIDALRLIDHLNATSEAYQQALLVEADRRRTAKDANAALIKLENGQMADFITMADAGVGPLNGIAKTSKAWQTMLDAAMEKARDEAPLKSAVAAARKAELAADEARAQMQVAAEAYSAAKHAADLMQVILGAVSK